MTETKLVSKVSGAQDGPVLLLLNSLGTTMEMWAPQLCLLEPHFRVIRMDTRGHGQSGSPPAPYSMDQIVDDAFSVLDRHGARKASVMGCSMGAMTAMGMALARPDLIEKIICVAARADAPLPFRQNWDDRIAIIESSGVAALWDGSLANWLTPAFRDAHPDTVERLRQDFLLTTDPGYRGCAMALKQLDYLRHMGGLAVPALFVAGAEDKAAPPETMREIGRACPKGQFAIVPGAGHIVNVNNPKGFNLAISEMLGLAVE